MPVSELAGKLAEYLPSHRGGGSMAAGILAGSMLRR